MKRNIVLYYFLMLLLVMGAFAAMALNSYGTILISYVAAAFAIVFLFELIFILPRESEMSMSYKVSLSLELLTLIGLCTFYFLKGISIEIPHSLTSRLILITILFGVNVYHFVRAFVYTSHAPWKVKGSIAMYFVALLLFIISTNLPSQISWITIPSGFICLLVFIVFGWWKGRVILNGEETSAWKKAIQFRNKSGIQLVFFTLAVSYFVLSAIRVLPPLYIGSLPNGYTKVVQQWEHDNTQTNPEEFERAYEKFLEGK